MKLSKKLFYILIFLCFVSKASGQNNLIIQLFNGTNKGIALSNIDKITFSGGNMNVNKTDVSFENLLLTDIRKITFGTLSGTNPISTNEFSINVFPNPATNFITVKNPSLININLIIYSLEGRCLLQKLISSQIEAIDISNLSQGIYLLKMNGMITKLIKR